VAFVETAFVPYVGKLTANTLRTAVRNGRIEALPLIPDAYARVAAQKSRTVVVTLETAVPADAGLLKTVEQRMSRRTGKTVSLETRVVAELLGGMRITWDDRVIDLSIAGRARKLRSLLVSG
jgi:F-type H+-transporting ATPase subunit delta